MTASRSAEPRLRAPRVVRLVADEEISRRAPRTPGEALRGEPGVWVQKTSHQSGTPVLRGLMGTQVLHLVDGFRLNNANFRFGPNQYLSTVDAAAIEGIEALLGPASTLYGSDAMGGVVNVRTRRARFSDAPEVAAGARLTLRGSSPDQDRLARQDLWLASRSAAARMGFTRRRVPPLRAGGGERLSPSGYGESAFDLDLAIRPRAGGELRLGFQELLQEEIGNWFRTRLDADRTETGRQHRQMTWASAERALPFARADRVAFRLVSHLQDERSRDVRRAVSASNVTSTATDDHIRVASQGFDLTVHGTLPEAGAWTAGLEQYVDSVRSDSVGTTLAHGIETSSERARPVAPSRYSLGGLFAGAEWTRGPLRVAGGFRLDRSVLRAPADPAGQNQVLPVALVSENLAATYRLGATYAALPWLNVFAHFGTCFRAPNVNDVTAFARFDAGFEVPSPDLAPERGWTGEAGVRLDRPGATLELSSFHSRYADFIGRERATWLGSATYQGQDVYRKANLGRVRILGWEAESRFALPLGFAAGAGGMFVQGDDVTVASGERTTVFRLAAGQPMRRMPPLSGRAWVAWSGLARKLEVSGVARVAKRQERWSPGDRSDTGMQPDLGSFVTPGFTVYHLRLGLRVARATWLRATLENAGDVRYWEHGSRIWGPGRTLMVSCDHAF